MSTESYLGLLVGFVIAWFLIDTNEDDDGPPDKGMMRPVYEGAK